MTTTTSKTPIYDGLVEATGIDPKRPFAFTVPPMTKRMRHRFAPQTEAVLVAAGFAPREK